MQMARRRRKFAEEDLYPTCFQLYLYPPKEDIFLEEFEELATSRQRVLHEISNFRERNRQSYLEKDAYDLQLFRLLLMELLPLESLLDYEREIPIGVVSLKRNSTLEREVKKHLSQRRRDHISHYILRLAYCTSKELSRWFLTQETELLRSRLLHGLHEEREQMILRYPKYLPLKRVVIPTVKELEKRERSCQVVSEEDKLLSEEIERVYPTMEKCSGRHEKESDCSRHEKESDCSSHRQNEYGSLEPTAQPSRTEFYQVHFTEVLHLVKHRGVIVKGGYAYLPLNNYKMVVLYICNKFRSLLSQDLEGMVDHTHYVMHKDERVNLLLRVLRDKHRRLQKQAQADLSAGSDSVYNS